VYENDDDFRAVPSWGVIPAFNGSMPFQMSDILPNFSPFMLLHGEQYLEILKYPVSKAAAYLCHH